MQVTWKFHEIVQKICPNIFDYLFP